MTTSLKKNALHNYKQRQGASAEHVIVAKIAVDAVATIINVSSGHTSSLSDGVSPDCGVSPMTPWGARRQRQDIIHGSTGLLASIWRRDSAGCEQTRLAKPTKCSSIVFGSDGQILRQEPFVPLLGCCCCCCCCCCCWWCCCCCCCC